MNKLLLPISPAPSPLPPAPRPAPLPRWLKRNVPKGDAGHFTAKLIGKLGLHTVCDHAKCPNRMECYSCKTATFMILGDICTRGCRFCGVAKGRPLPPDDDEPRRVAEAVAALGLRHVVITCVARDDLADGGAEHFVRTIRAIRDQGSGVRGQGEEKGEGREERGEHGTKTQDLKPKTEISKSPTLQISKSPTIEVLPSDFAGNAAAVERLVAASPDVYNHNAETVPRLFHVARDHRTDYRWTLSMFRRIHEANPRIALKTGLMLGLGETTDELLDTLSELYEAGCRMLTLGQYLRPSPKQMPVVRYVPPEEFEHLGELAKKIGYAQVAAGPFVRSSYHAREMLGGCAGGSH